MKDTKHVLAVMAHPDDIEFLCAGTLARLRRLGCQIHLATMTAGDCGSVELAPEQISRLRLREAARSAAILEATYDCLGCRDLFICYDRPTLCRVVELIRRYAPFLVITHSPNCYMLDHEETSRLVRGATFGAPIPNFKTEAPDPSQPTPRVPHLYYADAMEQKNLFGEPVLPAFYVDITTVMPIKIRMLQCHASQRNWLRKHHGMDEYIRKMKELSAQRGREVGVAYAEGFRQHLGHGYPQDNVLEKLLGVRKAPPSSRSGLGHPV